MTWTFSKAIRVALRVHGLWFLLGALFLEFLPLSLLQYLSLLPPDSPFTRVVFGIASAELLTGALFFLLASFQPRIPRFVFVIGLIQTAFNLYHNAVAFTQFSDESQIWIITLDTVIIVVLFLLYLAALRIKTE